jgi:hypothetical protein
MACCEGLGVEVWCGTLLLCSWHNIQVQSQGSLRLRQEDEGKNEEAFVHPKEFLAQVQRRIQNVKDSGWSPARAKENAKMAGGWDHAQQIVGWRLLDRL